MYDVLNPNWVLLSSFWDIRHSLICLYNNFSKTFEGDPVIEIGLKFFGSSGCSFLYIVVTIVTFLSLQGYVLLFKNSLYRNVRSIFHCSHPSRPRLEFWMDLVPFDNLNYVFLFYIQLM